MNQSIQAALERLRQRLIDEIDTDGWTVVTCFASETTPSFSYTIGLTEKGLPEIIVFGIPAEVARETLAGAIARLEEGPAPKDDVPVARIFANSPAFLKSTPADTALEYLKIAVSIYGDQVKVLQLVWPDEAGLFPWQSEFNEKFRPSQPILGQTFH